MTDILPTMEFPMSELTLTYPEPKIEQKQEILRSLNSFIDRHTALVLKFQESLTRFRAFGVVTTKTDALSAEKILMTNLLPVAQDLAAKADGMVKIAQELKKRAIPYQDDLEIAEKIVQMKALLAVVKKEKAPTDTEMKARILAPLGQVRVAKQEIGLAGFKMSIPFDGLPEATRHGRSRRRPSMEHGSI